MVVDSEAKVVSEGKAVENKAIFLKNKIKAIIGDRGLNTASDVKNGEVLNNEIIYIINKACDRAIANGRKTLMAKDF